MTGRALAAFRAEVLKLATLPAAWVASSLSVVVPLALTALNSRTVRRALETGNEGDLASSSTVDSGFSDVAIGVIGPVILGVVAVSSEYVRSVSRLGGGRQLATTMVSVPRRGRLIAAKLAALTAWIACLAAISVPLTIVTFQRLVGPYASELDDVLTRGLGVGAYWLTMGLIAFALATAARSGTIPLTFLLINASAVSLSLLLSRITSAVRFMPDVAWSYLTLRGDERPVSAAEPVEPAVAWLTLGCWAGAAVAASFLCFTRRDA
ncbi:MAG: hypothetical protein Q3979_01655 [Actinomycetaceae bacterium]|nr:hypothetical protein [Actinomycetaceae bacterium]